MSKEASGVCGQGTILFKAWIDGVVQLCRGGSGIQEFGSKALLGDLPMAQRALTGLLMIHEAARDWNIFSNQLLTKQEEEAEMENTLRL